MFRIITLLFFVLCILYAPITATAATQGLELAVQFALPALFPFFLASALLVNSNSIAWLGGLLAHFFARVYALPATVAGAFVLSVTGGYPVGTQTVAQLYTQGQLTRKQACHALTFCNNTGPAFLVSICGVGLLQSLPKGLLLYGVHVLSALAVGWLLRDRKVVTHGRRATCKSVPTASAQVPLSCFLNSVQQAGITALRVTAFIIVFVILRAILLETGLLTLLAIGLRPLCYLLGCAPEASTALLAGMLELTYGLHSLPEGAGATVLPAMSFLVAFGGFSVWAQSLAMLTNTDLPALPFVRGKVLHAVLAGGLTLLLCRIGGL